MHGDDARERRLAGARRPVEDHRADPVLRDRQPQRRALAEHLLLADELVERPRPQAQRERRRFVAGVPWPRRRKGRSRRKVCSWRDDWRSGGLHAARSLRRGRERLRALSPHRRPARPPEARGRAGPPRRAALPDRAPGLRAVAEARLDRGEGGDAAARAGGACARPSGCSAARSNASGTWSRSSTCSSRCRPGSTRRSARCSGTAAASTRPGSARSGSVTPELGQVFFKLLREPGDLARRPLRAGPRARGPLPAGRAADRLGRANRALADAALPRGRARDRRRGGRHPGHAGRAARRPDQVPVLPRALGRTQPVDPRSIEEG